MTQVTREQIERARAITALEYMRRYEPNELVRNGSTEFRLHSNHSLTLSADDSRGWYDHATGQGGHSALDLLTKAMGVGFVEAVERLAGSSYVPVQAAQAPREPEPRREFRLPERNLKDGEPSNARAFAYLHTERAGEPPVAN